MTNEHDLVVDAAKASSSKAKRNGTLGALGAFLGVVLALFIKHANDEKAAPASPTVPTCASADAREALKDAIEHNASENILTLRLLDIQDVQELKASKTARLCAATIVLNNGSQAARYSVKLTSDGSTLVEVGDGVDIASDATTVAPPAAEAAAPSAPPTATAVEPMDIEEVSKRYPAALDKWTAEVSTFSSAEDWAWAGDMDGLFDSIRTVAVGGRRFIFLTFFPQHMGGIMSATVMFSEDQSRVYGLLEDTRDGRQETAMGDPSPAELACLRHLIDDAAATACD